MQSFTTCDLYDRHGEVTQVLETTLRMYGARRRFGGQMVTVKCHEDNSRIKELLGTPGSGKVLVVDGGGSLRYALMGDLIAADAVKNGWEGVVIFGAVRDVEALGGMELGVLALGSTPRKTQRRNEGQTGLTVAFGGVQFKPGAFLYADADGVLVSDEPLL